MNKLLTSEEVGELLKVKSTYLRDMRSKGLIPYIKIGRLVRYDQYKLERWLESGKSADLVSGTVKRKLEA